MTTVRQIIMERQGAPSVLHYREIGIGKPGFGEVRLRHAAIGVNFVDTMFRDGTFPVSLPFVTGIEGAGVVEEVGGGASDFQVGDRVAYFYAPGAYSSERIMSAADLIPLPGEITFEQSAAFLTKGLTAWMALFSMHRIKAGSVVLVQGVSSNTGAILARWARKCGATVIGTVGSPRKLASAASASDHAISADDPDFVAKVKTIAAQGVDAVFEFVGAATMERSIASVRDGGEILIIGFSSGQPRINSTTVTRRAIRVDFGSTPKHVWGDRVGEAASQLFDQIKSGTFADIEITKRDLADAVRVHEDIAERQLSGPVILIP